MAKVSLKSVVVDIKDTYVEATGDAEEITYGNINNKLNEALNSGGDGGYGGVSVIPVQSITEAMPTTTTITVSA